MRLHRRTLVWVLLAAAALLLLVAVVAGVVYVVLRGQRTAASGWQDPLAAIVTEEVAPDLALYPLAGAASLETVDASLANGELTTALVTLAHDLDATDRQRIGRLTLLADGYAQAGRSDMALLCYQLVYDTALLSPQLNDPMRADALLAAGKGWLAMERKKQAQSAYDQAYLIASESPYLHRAYRRGLFTMLEVAYEKLGALEQAKECRSQITAIDQEPGSQLPVTPAAWPDLPLIGNTVSSPEVGALEEARRKAAYDVLQVVSTGRDPSSRLVTQLAQALQAEDGAKLALYQGELAGTTQSSRRIDVHWQTIRWLLLKHQVATQGFGLSLVPDWEQQVADIRSALSKEYEDLLFDYEDLVSALPDASLIAPGRYMVLRLVTLAGRLGDYPNYPAEQLVDKLQAAAAEMASSGSTEALLVDVMKEEGGVDFFFSPAAQYGRAGTER